MAGQYRHQIRAHTQVRKLQYTRVISINAVVKWNQRMNVVWRYFEQNQAYSKGLPKRTFQKSSLQLVSTLELVCWKGILNNFLPKWKELCCESESHRFRNSFFFSNHQVCLLVIYSGSFCLWNFKEVFLMWAHLKSSFLHNPLLFKDWKHLIETYVAHVTVVCTIIIWCILLQILMWFSSVYPGSTSMNTEKYFPWMHFMMNRPIHCPAGL